MTIQEKFASILARAETKQGFGVSLVADGYGNFHPRLVEVVPACSFLETPPLLYDIYVARGHYGNAALPAEVRAAQLAEALGIMDPYEVDEIIGAVR